MIPKGSALKPKGSGLSEWVHMILVMVMFECLKWPKILMKYTFKVELFNPFTESFVLHYFPISLVACYFRRNVSYEVILWESN